MRSALVAAQKRAGRARKGSLSTVPPAINSEDFNAELAAASSSILYLSPLPSPAGRPLYILNAAAFPDASEVDYDALLSYVLARLPGEDELLSGREYEIIFFAGGSLDNATSEKRQGPGMGWYLQAYHVLSRATRKKLQKLYIVHPRTWVRVLIGVFGTVVSPKFRRKIVHDNTLTSLAEQIPIQRLLIPPAVYLHDRKLQSEIYVAGASGRRAFGVRHPLPKNLDTGETRLPRVLRETTTFVLMPVNIRTEGLFRIPPHATLQSVLKEAYDRGQLYIVWKERGATFASPGTPPALVNEVRLEDAYGVHLAASLIKQWYRELRDPIFPETSYDYIRTAYGDPSVEIGLHELVNFFSPGSDASPLTTTARKILTRHLFPLLSRVNEYEPDNRMGAANLAICFSMCLICGSNQLEDAKMSSILKRILTAAIAMWPQLRQTLNLSDAAFHDDLLAPADIRNYEDPLEEDHRHRISQYEPTEGHRIQLNDTETVTPPEPAKASTRPMTWVETPRIMEAPPRPSKPSSTVTPNLTLEPTPIVPQRKPAPQAQEPPRYSSVFDVDGNSLHIADSPSVYGPANGFGPSQSSAWSVSNDDKGTTTRPHSLSYPPSPSIIVPKRKAVSSEKPSPDVTAEPSPSAPSFTTEVPSEPPAFLAAQQGVGKLAQQVAAAAANQSSGRSSPNGATAAPQPEGQDDIFRKPSWPASARPQVSSRPDLPPRPVSSNPNPTTPTDSTIASTSTLPMIRPRAPSPALLKRMNSMEPPLPSPSSDSAVQKSQHLGLGPRPLNLSRSSVDDLRRLYEERATTAQTLASAGLLRKTSV